MSTYSTQLSSVFLSDTLAQSRSAELYNKNLSWIFVIPGRTLCSGKSVIQFLISLVTAVKQSSLHNFLKLECVVKVVTVL